MFEIETVRTGARLLSRNGLTAGDFAAIAGALGATPVRARRVGYVSARQSETRQLVETLWNEKESTFVADVGDWVVTNLGADRSVLRDRTGHANVYVLKEERFRQLFVRDEGATDYGVVCRSVATIEALVLSGGFEIMAPWGEMQRATSGYLVKNGNDIYGINKEFFESAYETIS